MATKIRDLKDLVDVAYKKWSQLDDIDVEYLSDAGKAAKEAYRSVIWYSGFYNDIASLGEDENFINLVSIPGKHPEYYKVLRKVNRAIDNSLKI